MKCGTGDTVIYKTQHGHDIGLIVDVRVYGYGSRTMERYTVKTSDDEYKNINVGSILSNISNSLLDEIVVMLSAI